MVLLDMLFALTVAAVLTAVFSVGYRKQRSGAVLSAFFIITFLAAWAGGTWLEPAIGAAGTTIWVPFLLVGIFAALLFTSILYSVHPPGIRAETISRASEPRITASFVFNIFFWILVLVLGIVILGRYVIYPSP